MSTEAKALVRVDLYAIVGGLVNLLTNAIDAMNGKGTLTVATEVGSHGKEAVVRIHNTGAKYTQEEIDGFFIPGYSTKDRTRHWGLGLAITKVAFDASGGHLQMASPEGGGVEALVRFPILDVPCSQDDGNRTHENA